jgi:hypothetical protein
MMFLRWRRRTIAAAAERPYSHFFDWSDRKKSVRKVPPADGTIAARSAPGFRHIPPQGQLGKSYMTLAVRQSGFGHAGDNRYALKGRTASLLRHLQRRGGF